MLVKAHFKGEEGKSVVGEKVFEDERFLVLRTKNTPRVKVPHINILYLEEYEVAPKQQEPPPPPPPTPHGEGSPPPLPPGVQMPDKEEQKDPYQNPAIQKALTKMKQKVKQKQNEPPPEKSGVMDFETANVEFKGYKVGNFSIQVPSSIMEKEWSPELAKLVFRNPEIKAFTDGFNISDIPKVEGNNILINTNPLRAGGTAGEKAAANLGSITEFLNKTTPTVEKKFEKPEKEYDVDFAMGTGVNPFDEMIDLAGEEVVDSSEQS